MISLCGTQQRLIVVSAFFFVDCRVLVCVLGWRCACLEDRSKAKGNAKLIYINGTVVLGIYVNGTSLDLLGYGDSSLADRDECAST
jgi:hypothetical protein